jgi:hypothetical protein
VPTATATVPAGRAVSPLRRIDASASPAWPAPRRTLRLAGAIASAAAVALLPKCPLCLVACLSVLGVGAGAAGLAGALYPIAGIAAAAIACVLGARLVRDARRSRRILPALASAAALGAVAIAWFFEFPAAVRVAPLAVLSFALGRAALPCRDVRPRPRPCARDAAPGAARPPGQRSR